MFKLLSVILSYFLFLLNTIPFSQFSFKNQPDTLKVQSKYFLNIHGEKI